MEKQKFAARVDNIYFLSRIGSSLRWATQGIAPEELSTNIKHLLARLDQLEAISRQTPITILLEPTARRAGSAEAIHTQLQNSVITRVTIYTSLRQRQAA